ncbi:hypothetical protein A2397_05265 [Candidatus Amesbacteria bacterium RIFOXYB1_FULL_44_23]|uniref:Uncharacterized protein n=1 Tax=Candidatus Amesbacteria bacterium RIFOXYB1_FULL_44_23 TaxID=1797263 RepID=A0A1F4ZR50_9BACT|nr:MAG: hypothetical protein A2397_05265 [Candidatus Amesbacteria bacterium RIFOXYB1_FULL_44_23]
MSNSLAIKTTNDDFIERHVTDKVYRKIVKELSAAEDTKGRGRKLELTAEKLHNFLYYLSIGANYNLASEAAQISESTRQKYMARSEEFRRVASLAKENLKIIALVAISKAMLGRKPGYYQYIHPVTKEAIYILEKEISPNLRACMWWLDKTRYFEERREEGKENRSQLGYPQNEREAELLEMVLNRHYDYVRKREQEDK